MFQDPDGDHAFSVAAPSLWSNLAFHIRSDPSLEMSNCFSRLTFILWHLIKVRPTFVFYLFLLMLVIICDVFFSNFYGFVIFVDYSTALW